MKKFLAILTMLFLISPIFAKMTQCVKGYQTYDNYDSTDRLASDIQYMINQGWKVVSITSPIIIKYGSSSYVQVIVLFEKEE